MKILQWSMTIPKEKQIDFEKWFKNTSGPILKDFGALKHELYKVEDKEVVGRLKTEEDRYIEMIYFEDSYNISEYFRLVKENPRTWEVSREYENTFSAKDIELRVLNSVYINSFKIL